MKTTVDVNRELADEAAEILGTRSLKETVNGALYEIVAAKHRSDLAKAVRDGTLSVPTLEEVERSKAPKVPIGALSDWPWPRRAG